MGPGGLDVPGTGGGTPLALRCSKIALLGAAAFYVSLAAFNNITDYGSNFAFVSHVLMMDTTFENNEGGWRAVSTPNFHHAAYVLIIALQVAVAALCWAGCVRLWRARRDVVLFAAAKTLGICGLTLGVLLWFGGFVSVGGEWFLMWQSATWNGVATSFHIATLFALVLLYLTQTEPGGL